MKKFLAFFTAFLVLVMFLLLFTNPSLKRFKEFTGKYKGLNEKVQDHRRTRNYFIFSIYEIKTLSNDPSGMMYDTENSCFQHFYVGIVGNFFWRKTKRLELEGTPFSYPYIFPEGGSNEEGNEED